MILKNTLSVFYINTEKEENKKDEKSLYIYIETKSSNPDKGKLALPEIEFAENDTFKESTRRFIWNTFKIDNYDYIRSQPYDDLILYEDRVLQISNICILKGDIQLNENWYKLSLSDSSIILCNSIKNITVKYKVIDGNVFVTSATEFLAQNHTKIMLESYERTKRLFLYGNLIFSNVNDLFTINDLCQIMNMFVSKSVSQSTAKRRFEKRIIRTDKTITNVQAKQSYLYRFNKE